MATDDLAKADAPRLPDAFIDAWAAVFINVYEKLKERGELPDDDIPSASPQVGERLDAVNKNNNKGELACSRT